MLLEDHPVKFNEIKVSDNPVQNLKFKIRHNLVDDQSKARKQLKALERKAS